MTLESSIASANIDGWLVGSLCQLALGDWYVCMIDDAGFAHTATGTAIIEAIHTAMNNPPSGRLWSRVAGLYEDERGKAIDLVALGLVKKKQIDRRF